MGLPFSEQWRRGRSGTSYVLLTLVLVVAASLLSVWFAVIRTLIASEAVRTRGFDPGDFTPESVGFTQPVFLALILLPFLFGLVALLGAVRLVHQRSPLTLIAGGVGRVRWSRLVGAFLTWTAIVVVGEALGARLQGREVVFNQFSGEFLASVGVVVVLVPLQVAFEELLFRGYLHQELVRVAHRPWLAVCITSLVFGGLHYSNPEVARFGLAVMAPYYVSVGLFLAGLSVADDGLEIPLGIHLGTNLLGAAVINYDGSALPTLTLVTVSANSGLGILTQFALQAATFAGLYTFLPALRRQLDWSRLRASNPPTP